MSGRLLAGAAGAAAAAALAVLAACGGATERTIVEGGDEARGARLIEHYGCGGCHTIPGIEGANANVGPPLANFDENRFIAGQIPNNVENAIRWITDPQEIEPETLMPDLGVSPEDARDIVAYLYTQ